ncbi:MAG: hypothetical protein A3K18_35035 [Lentisphaerae bacterium RIFOXYA12_64_32]|nr:MAG: hypothetical protein A3K18_35035 [Lentisphaerae bacterium RIFOXYA12_64_32]
MEVQALVTAEVEGTVSNARLREVTTEHPADITKVLQGLVGKGLLGQRGQKRGAVYEASRGRAPATRAGVTPGANSSHSTAGDSSRVQVDSIHSDSIHSPEDSIHSEEDSIHFGSFPDAEVAELRRITLLAKLNRHLSAAETRRLILDVCKGRHLTGVQIGALLVRNPVGLRQRFLRPMVAAGLLRFKYPDEPNRPDQAYTAAGGAK